MEKQQPAAGADTEPSPTGENLRFEVFKLEYENLAEGYRHTYQTIWQAGSVFMSVSAALLAFGSGGAVGDMTTIIRLIWPLPFFFWWLGVFTPMDKIAKKRRRRLEALEKITRDDPGFWGHKMNHFSADFDAPDTKKKRPKLILLKNVHVGWMVDIFGIIIALVWIYSNIGLLLKRIGL